MFQIVAEVRKGTILIAASILVARRITLCEGKPCQLAAPGVRNTSCYLGN